MNFKCYHLSIVDLIKSTDELENEQASMDDYDDKVTGLFDRLTCLAIPEEREEKSRLDPREHMRKRLQRLEHDVHIRLLLQS